MIFADLSQFFANTNKTNMIWLWKITLKAYWDQFLLALSYLWDKCVCVMHREMPDWHIHSGVPSCVHPDCCIASSERFCHWILIKPTVDKAQTRLNTTHPSLPQSSLRHQGPEREPVVTHRENLLVVWYCQALRLLCSPLITSVNYYYLFIISHFWENENYICILCVHILMCLCIS